MTTFGSHLTRIMYALGDPLEGTWSRANEVWYWLIEAIREFPILRPMTTDLSDAIEDHKFDLPADFKEVVNVQWPITEDYRYHLRKSHLDEDFFDGDYYDIDRNYPDGAGWVIWMGQSIPYAQPCRVNYLALHDTAMGEATDMTVPDEYLNILTEYCIMRAWMERLSTEIANPTAHDATISMINGAIQEHRNRYHALLNEAIKELGTSRITSKHKLDKHDRIY